jgi:tetratricopeptide (TPR) repeat protein
MKGDREKALGYFKKLDKMGYNCVDYLYDLADMLASEGRYMEAVQLLEAALESNNRHKDTQALLDSCRGKIRSEEKSEKSGPRNTQRLVSCL